MTHKAVPVFLGSDAESIELKRGQCIFAMMGSEYDVENVIVDVHSTEIKVKKSEQTTTRIGHSLRCPARLKTEVAQQGSFAAACCVVCERINPKGELQVLITKRSKKLRSFPNVWVFPGGHVDHGETLVDAAEREVREEIGFEINKSALKCVGLWESVYPSTPDLGNIQRQHVVVFFSIILDYEITNDIKLCPVEVSGAGWLNMDQIPYIVNKARDRIPTNSSQPFPIVQHSKEVEMHYEGIKILEDGSHVDKKYSIEKLLGIDKSGEFTLANAPLFILAELYGQNDNKL